MIRTILFSLILSSVFTGCNYFEKPTEENVVARVNDNYLYLSEVESLVPENSSKEDSILIVNNYINRWATQQLLIEQAKINLSPDKLQQFDKLVEEYKNDLLTESYKGAVVGKQIDSVITEEDYRIYYSTNIDNFRLKDLLVKLRYIHFPSEYDGIQEVKQKLSRYDKKDKVSLTAENYRYVSSNFNDSVWIKKQMLLSVLPVLKGINEQVLKKSNFVQLQDSLGVYLVKIEDVLNPNDTPPLSYIKPTLKQIILNKRKLELIKKFEADITKDAIETKNFEIYTNE